MKNLIIGLLLIIVCGCGKVVFYEKAEFNYWVSLSHSEGANVVIPFWADLPSTTEKYDTNPTITPTVSAPLIGKGVQSPRSFADIPPDSRSIIYIWSAKRGMLKTTEEE